MSKSVKFATTVPQITPLMVIGLRIRHQDGTPGTVTAIHAGKPGERLVEWVYCGQWRVSGEQTLTPIGNDKPRWRK